jgi:voltage-gated potassium channel
VIETLDEAGDAMQVVLINQMASEAVEPITQAHPNLEIRFNRGDFTKEEILERANIRHASCAIFLPDRSDPSSVASPDQRTILAAHVIRSINPEIKVYAHVLEEENTMDVKRAEVDGVVVSDAYSGELLADYVVSPGTPQVLDRLLDDQTPPNIRRMPIPDRFVGSPSAEFFSHFKEANNWILLGYVRESPGFGLDDAISGGSMEIANLIRRKVQEAGIKTRTKSRVDVAINPPNDYTIREGDHAIVICSE